MNINNDNLCPICLEILDLDDLSLHIKLQCGHEFCKNCIVKWYNGNNYQNKLCPLCRKNIQITDISKTYKPIKLRLISEIDMFLFFSVICILKMFYSYITSITDIYSLFWYVHYLCSMIIIVQNNYIIRNQNLHYLNPY